jgi:hypothetical protein
MTRADSLQQIAALTESTLGRTRLASEQRRFVRLHRDNGLPVPLDDPEKRAKVARITGRVRRRGYMLASERRQLLRALGLSANLRKRKDAMTALADRGSYFDDMMRYAASAGLPSLGKRR